MPHDRAHTSVTPCSKWFVLWRRWFKHREKGSGKAQICHEPYLKEVVHEDIMIQNKLYA